jgi:hypothetical protein
MEVIDVRDEAVARLVALRRAAEAEGPEAGDAARVADLEQQLIAANARIDALRRAADAEPRRARPGTDDPDQTQVLSAIADDDRDAPRAEWAPSDPDDADAANDPRTTARDGAIGEPRGAARDGATRRVEVAPASAREQSATRRGGVPPLWAQPGGEDPDTTQPFSARDQRQAEDVAEPVPIVDRASAEMRRRGVAPWIAVAALAIFVVVLLGLLLGFVA